MTALARRALGPPDPHPPSRASPSANMAPIIRAESHRLIALRAVRPRNLDLSVGIYIPVDRYRTTPYHGHRWQHQPWTPPGNSEQLAGGVPRLPGTRHPRRRSHRRQQGPPHQSASPKRPLPTSARPAAYTDPGIKIPAEYELQPGDKNLPRLRYRWAVLYSSPSRGPAVQVTKVSGWVGVVVVRVCAESDAFRRTRHRRGTSVPNPAGSSRHGVRGREPGRDATPR
jgi:hypothetical protein